MITVLFRGKSYTCAVALKGTDYIHLLDANNKNVAFFDGVSDFTDFTISGGSWTTPATPDECYLVTMGEDGTLHKGSHKCSDIAGMIYYNKAQSLTEAQKAQARANIGANAIEGFVKYTESQSLTTQQKATARENIGAAAAASLAAVATSGSYNDLLNKPTIPAAQVQPDWNATSGMGAILNKPALKAVATSGSYNDLTNKPTIPAAQVQSDWNATVGMGVIKNKPSIPAKVSDLQNDLNFTANAGTITGIKMNGATKGTSGVVDLGTVLTAHQDISGKANIASPNFTGTIKKSGANVPCVFMQSTQPTAKQVGDIWLIP